MTYVERKAQEYDQNERHPGDPLEALIRSVIEDCAKLCDDSDLDGAWSIADGIRALATGDEG